MSELRTPVLLLHGWNGNARQLRKMADFLAADGWGQDRVLAHGFRHSWGSNIDNAAEIESAIESLRERTAHHTVDVIAHSMSGLAVRWYLAHCTTPAIRRVIFLASPHKGTWLAHFAWGGGAREMRPGSEFLQRLSASPLPPELRAYTIRTLLETRVVPLQNTCLDGACRDHVIRHATHISMLRSRKVFRIVREWLMEEAGTGP